jgi:hypothetical protein
VFKRFDAPNKDNTMYVIVFRREHGSNDHFVLVLLFLDLLVLVLILFLLLLPSFVQFNGRPPGGAIFQY